MLRMLWSKYRLQAACVGFALACALSAWVGWAVAQTSCHAATLLIKNQYAAEQLKAQQTYAAALADALAKQQAAVQWAQQQGEQLAATRAQLEQRHWQPQPAPLQPRLWLRRRLGSLKSPLFPPSCWQHTNAPSVPPAARRNICWNMRCAMAATAKSWKRKFQAGRRGIASSKAA